MQHRKNMSRNRVLFVLGALSVLLHPRPASAQIVTGRVTASSLNVRAGSSSDFDVVEVVHEGELLTIVDDVPWWYEVRTPSGQPGFAFKRWVELVLTPTTRGLRIVHFQVDPYFTVKYPGQPEDNIRTYEYFESREMAMEKGRLIALLHLKRLLDGS